MKKIYDKKRASQIKWHTKMINFANKMIGSQVSDNRYEQLVYRLDHGHTMFIVHDISLAEKVEEIITMDLIDKAKLKAVK